jgi:hypothetical protein
MQFFRLGGSARKRALLHEYESRALSGLLVSNLDNIGHSQAQRLIASDGRPYQKYTQ